MAVKLKAIEQCFHAVLFGTLLYVDESPGCDHSNETYCPRHSRGTVCYMLYTVVLWMKPYCATNQIEPAIEQHIHAVLFVMLYKVVLTFTSCMTNRE